MGRGGAFIYSLTGFPEPRLGLCNFSSLKINFILFCCIFTYHGCIYLKISKIVHENKIQILYHKNFFIERKYLPPQKYCKQNFSILVSNKSFCQIAPGVYKENTSVLEKNTELSCHLIKHVYLILFQEIANITIKLS